MPSYEVEFPDYGGDAYWEPKGYLQDVIVRAEGGRLFRLCFYDPTRLSQDSTEALQSDAAFFQPNLVVVSRVAIGEMLEAIRALAEDGFTGLAATPG